MAWAVTIAAVAALALAVLLLLANILDGWSKADISNKVGRLIGFLLMFTIIGAVLAIPVTWVWGI